MFIIIIIIIVVYFSFNIFYVLFLHDTINSSCSHSLERAGHNSH